MNARDAILARLRNQTREAALPPAWPFPREFDSLPERFAAALSAVHGEPIVARSLEDALPHLDALFEELRPRKVVATREGPLTRLGLPARYPAAAWLFPGEEGQSPGELRAFCAEAGLGLSSAQAALAETGSLVVASGPGRSRLATLLPPVHAALVPFSRLTPDIFTWAAARTGEMPAALTFISGPSKTADIEQTLSIGVHGPKRLVVILYPD